MSVRKRIWTWKGEVRERWMVDYSDATGTRRSQSFARKKDADARNLAIKTELAAGTHVAASRSITVASAAESWIKGSEANGLERSTVKQYREHASLHIIPAIGHLKLSDLNPQVVRRLEDDLREQGRSPAMVSKIIRSLGSLLADAHEQGLVLQNAVRDLRSRRQKRKHVDQRRKKLEVGVDIPSGKEVALIMSNAPDRWRALLITAVFTGLRASELRGLRWKDVDLKAGELHVRQRADRFNKIGQPKSEAGTRTVPFGKVVANTLKEWRLACPNSELDLVFPNGAGRIENLANIINRGLIPACISGGVATKTGKAKYTGLHSLRHFYASWCINRHEDGGLGLPPKVVQERLGHASITMTFDRYGHLFPRGDNTEFTDAAELRLMGRA
jgi:integrase